MAPHPPVRVADAGDASLLAELLIAFDGEFDTPVDRHDVLSARFEALLRHDAAFAVLAGSVGFALVTLRPVIWFDGPLATLDELYVAPTHRSRGLGSALLAAVRAEGRARGCPELHVNVDEVDTDARRFYERHGLVNVERPEDGRMLLLTGPTGPPEPDPTSA